MSILPKDAVTCLFKDGPPRLVIQFDPGIHPDNIRQISEIVCKAVANKMECMNLTAIEGEGHAGNA